MTIQLSSILLDESLPCVMPVTVCVPEDAITPETFLALTRRLIEERISFDVDTDEHQNTLITLNNRIL